MDGHRAVLSPKAKQRRQGSRVDSDQSNPTQYPSFQPMCIRGLRFHASQDPLKGQLTPPLLLYSGDSLLSILHTYMTVQSPLLSSIVPFAIES